MLGSLFGAIAISSTKLKLPFDKNSPGTEYIVELTDSVYATGYSYKDELTSTAATNSLSLFPGNSAELVVTPVNDLGQQGTPRVGTWDLKTDTIAAKPGFGGFQFAPNQSPDTVLEFFDGTTRGQVDASGFTFGTSNPVVQLVGKTNAPVTLALRGTASPNEFNVVTRLDQTSPAIFSAIAQKTALPEIKITERRTMLVAGSQQFLPYREWVLTNVFVESMADSATASSPFGTVGLTLNPGSATSTLINYDAAGKAVPASRSIDFVTPPTPIPFGTIAAISTDPDRLIDLPTRFTDQEATSTLRYTPSVVNGANLFDSVTVNTANRLVLNYKAGQSGFGQVRVDATDSFGLVGSLLVNVAVDVDGVTAAPAGTNLTVSTNEDSTYTITAADFGFTDPNDFPANTFTAVTVSSLPVKGSLTLNNVPVTVNQLITIANINSGLLKYTPLPNENGNAYASFQFQVRDNGSVSNVDLSPNTLTFNVTPVNDAPVVAGPVFSFTMPAIAEDAPNPAGVLLSSVASLITDVDVADLKGVAVFNAEAINGTWQYALDGSTWLSLNAVSTAAARLLPIDAITRVRFVPNANFNGSAGLLSSAWDRTTGTVGGTADTSVFGGTTAFSTNVVQLVQSVTPVNDAPTLNTANVTLPSINEDTANPAGVLVSSLLTGMSDIDSGSAQGMAVRSVQNTNGAWQYSLNGGTSWIPFGSGVSAATARLLPADARVRFLANANFAGNRGFNFYAWDQTSGTAGNTVDLTLPGATGGTTAFSTNFVFATQVIAAVNDTPTISSPNTAALVVNTPLVFSIANGNAITVSDIDAGSSEIEVAFTAFNARFTLSTLTGITVTVGSNGTGAFTGRGTLTALNAALASSSLVGNEDYFGNGFLRLVVNDLGNTGSGGAKTRTKTTEFSIQALSAATSLGALDGVSATGFENGSFTTGVTASRFYSFSLPGAADVRLVLSGLTANADLRLFRTNGQLLSEGTNTGVVFENVLASALAAGTYIVAVRPTGVATAFNLSVSTATASDDLIVNANVLGTLNATTLPTVRVSETVSGVTDRQDYFRFTTTVASPLRVNVSGLTDDFDVRLLNADGVVVSSSVLPGLSIETIARSNLPAGDYFVQIFGLANRNFTPYDLSITLASTSDDSISQAVALGTLDASTLPVVRRVAPPVGGTNVQDYHSFVLSSPTDVRINLTGLSADIDLQLQDSFGRPLAFGSFGGNQSENVLATALAAGTYYVRVNPFQSAVSAYELSVAINPASDDLLTNAVSLGALSATVATLQRTGDVNSVSDRTDYYSFTLGSTADVRVNLSGMSGDADIILEDSFGRFIALSATGGNTIENLSRTALAAGTYLVRVQTSAATTNYVLAVSQTPTSDDLISNATVLPTLTSGTLPTSRTSSVVGGSDIQDYYRFDLTTAGNLRLNLSNMTTDLDVEVLDQFGQVIVFGAQSGNTIERVLTPVLAVGTYYVRVFQLFGSGPVSNYNLEISTDFNGDDTIRSANPLGTLAAVPLTASGTVGGAADIQDYFSFTTTTTRNVRFLLTGLSTDIDVQILDSFGRVVGSGTSGSTTTEDFTLNALPPGSYFIRIFPFVASTISNYSLSVS